jgi:hypothetical protein
VKPVALNEVVETLADKRRALVLVLLLAGKSNNRKMNTAIPRSDRSTVGIILPPVWAQVYLNQARLLQYSLEDLDVQAEVVEYAGHLQYDWHVILGWNLFEEPFPPGRRYIIYQLEPLCFEFWQQRLRQKKFLFDAAEAVWDYSKNNLHFLEGLASYWVPHGYHSKLHEVELKTKYHEFDVLFVGFVSPRRRYLLEQLANRCSLSMRPRWGTDFGQALANSKILINIHQYGEPTPLEQPRISYALNQGSFVLTESSADEPYPWLRAVAFDEIIDWALYYLYNPVERLEKQRELFSRFSSYKMTENIRRALDPILPLSICNSVS